MIPASDSLSGTARWTRTPRVRAPASRRAILALDVLAGVLAVLLVASPLLFSSSGFEQDFTNHMWASWVAGIGLREAGHPTYFINTLQTGVFEPLFAFYGGTLYTAVGALGQLLGNRPVAAYEIFTTAVIAGCYTGIVSLARQVGVSRTLSHVPALVVVTSAYFITNLYGRGAWTEFVGTAMVPPLLASGLRLARSWEWRPTTVATFAVSVILCTGSHNITLVWVVLTTAVGLAAIWLGLGCPLRLPWLRLAGLAVLGLVALAANAWFLLPDVSWAGKIVASTETGTPQAIIFDTPGILFDPLRRVPVGSTTPGLFVQLPVWFLAWSLVAGVLLVWRRRVGTGLRGVWAATALVLALIVVVIAVAGVWKVIPYPWNTVQFPYRLGSYADYGVAALAAISLLALARTRSARLALALRVSLVGVCLVSLGLAIWQMWVPNTLVGNSYVNRADAVQSPYVAPKSWYDPGSYNDISAPVVSVSPKRTLTIDPSAVHGGTFSGWVDPPAGRQPIATNIVGGPYIVSIRGLERVGRTATGFTVVERPNGGRGRVHVVIATAHNKRIQGGRILTLIAGVLLVIVVILAGVRQWVQARRRPAAAPSAQ